MAPTDINTRALETWRSLPRFSVMDIKINSNSPAIDFDLPYSRLSTPNYLYEGQTRESHPFGVGRLLATSSGNIFEGQLDGEMKHGYGRITYGSDVDFTYYLGLFKDD
jgi:hypothetical protein